MSRKAQSRRKQSPGLEMLENRCLLSLGVPALSLGFGSLATIGNLSVEKADVAVFDGATAKKIVDGAHEGLTSCKYQL